MHDNHRRFLFSVLVILAYATQSTHGSGPTSIYIDLIPGYHNLSSCAVVPLSTLVRNMFNGCGDDSQLTSYSCFCTDSYSKFSWDISTAVVAGCGSSRIDQATSAVDVFHGYCRDGTLQLTRSCCTGNAAPTTAASR
ncbi:hypothetical protein B0T22DRAFT_445518 [Podospora appendiculata]|uniref:Cyanovirin-N domain-containing protein n=1 Tax=Podospora appendiculata TaxID=314037 RepID=A0AAE1C7C6_9PEZI|nr:hypothetical protein B0T22DRAFT_445518 [Podospora appendiculata]